MWYVLKCWMFSFGAGGFSSSLDVLPINIFNFDQKNKEAFFNCKISQFLGIKFLNPIRIRIDLKCWIRIQICIETKCGSTTLV